MTGDRRDDLPDDDPTIDVLLTVLERTAAEELAKVPDILDDLGKCILPLHEVMALHDAGMNRAWDLIIRFRALQDRVKHAIAHREVRAGMDLPRDGPPDG